MQFNRVLENVAKVDPEAPVKLILEITPYTEDTIKAIKKQGFEVEFEMPLLKRVCGAIPAKQGGFIKRLADAGTIKKVEICGLSAVETM